MYCQVESCSGCSPNEMRRFLTKEEKIELLNEYKEYLDKESRGVSERIEELRKDD